MDEVEEKVRLIVSQQLGKSLSAIQNSDSFKDLGADSLDSVSLLFSLEEELGIEISDEQALKITTVQQAIDFSKMILKK